jgi:hypothetical protein
MGRPCWWAAGGWESKPVSRAHAAVCTLISLPFRNCARLARLRRWSRQDERARFARANAYLCLARSAPQSHQREP